MRVIDMAGKKFGSLTVVSRAENSLRGQAMWVVRCGCSTPIEFVALGNNLRRGNTTGCVCTKRERARQVMTKVRSTINDGIESELMGKKFGNLTVVSKWDVTRQDAGWLCKCFCGRDDKVLVRTAAPRSGSRKACKYCRARLSPETAMRNQLLIIYKAALGDEATNGACQTRNLM